MLIWAHGLAPDVNPVKELYESLTAIGKRNVAGNKLYFDLFYTVSKIFVYSFRILNAFFKNFRSIFR